MWPVVGGMARPRVTLSLTDCGVGEASAGYTSVGMGGAGAAAGAAEAGA